MAKSTITRCHFQKPSLDLVLTRNQMHPILEETFGSFMAKHPI
jgi:hypothetical protein